MIARAGGLDQGNIILNLIDASAHLPKGQVLYLAGSAINSLLGTSGKVDVGLGAQAIACDNIDRFSRATVDEVQIDAGELRLAGVRWIVTASHGTYPTTERFV